jgi:release factor glutamine methyltransferase
VVKKLLNFLQPILAPVTQWYLSKDRHYNYKGIKIKVLAGVFHPGLFFSTKILLSYLSKINLKEKRVLELGAGTGLISIFCKTCSAIVTATDISAKAIENISTNCQLNNVNIRIIKSSLFENCHPNDFDFIIINPPYYPKNAKNEAEHAWYCGEDFEYFKNLFYQLNLRLTTSSEVIMILSEDCEMIKIKELAGKANLTLTQIYKEKNWAEWNYIFKIKNESNQVQS